MKLIDTVTFWIAEIERRDRATASSPSKESASRAALRPACLTSLGLRRPARKEESRAPFSSIAASR